jgi:heat shock protein 4
MVCVCGGFVFVFKKDKTQFKEKLQEGEDWLYSDEGFDTTKDVYEQKLDDLKQFGNQPERRKTEANARPQATSDLLSIIEQYKSIATVLL